MSVSMDEGSEQNPLASKRRRKINVNEEKKFECKYEGCGKTYSRAEHLYRHHLNHEPKAIYYCRHPGCSRDFVRQDLRTRHEERHSTRGSQLQKRDASSYLPSSADRQELSFPACGSQPPPAISAPYSTSTSADGRSYVTALGGHVSDSMNYSRISESIASTSSTSVESRNQPPTPRTVLQGLGTPFRPDSSPHSYTLSPPQKHGGDPTVKQEERRSMSGDFARSFPSNTVSAASPPACRNSLTRIPTGEAPLHPRGLANPINKVNDNNNNDDDDDSNDNNNNNSNFSTNAHFPLSSLVGFPSPEAGESPSKSIATAVAHSFGALDATSSALYGMPVDTSSAALTYLTFGHDEYQRSPVAREQFVTWVFGGNQQAMAGFVPGPNMLPGYGDTEAPHLQEFFYPDPQFDVYYPTNVQPQDPMRVMSVLQPTAPTQTCMSEEKRQEILNLMRDQFHERAHERTHDAVRGCQGILADSDDDADSHILSLRMLHCYVGSYFYHQHAQLPILHRPTFCADKTPNLLLLIVIAIGAATLDKAHGNALTDAAAVFANFIAWHVRWEIVRDEGYGPPAKLWVFQTLILLETYEKMYSTRALHERAHINHDTTLTLMRRGTLLIGRTANESPGSLGGGKTARSSASTSASDSVASDESWSQWVRNEATRRIAFAAFVIDSIHATMFGHSAKMVAYEIHLPLPCDEALWSASSAAEVARVQSSYQTNGIKPIMFLDGLKQTLNGEKVRTNSFGRTVLMCGLLCVNYLLNQRDLQVSVLGTANVQAPNASNRWRTTLLGAFDNWKKDFDDAITETHSSEGLGASMSAWNLRRTDDDNLFESRIALHHLAHIASCVDVFDCQVFAGANSLLGRPIGVKDFNRVRDKLVTHWVRTANARDAVFHALKFLIEVLVQPTGTAGGPAILHRAFDEQGRYLARDDFLLNRPWVLYFSALVVWCYGFALEGPISPALPDSSSFATPQDKHRHMRAFLERVGRVKTSAELESIHGMNHCVGLLMVLRDSFDATRWELTHEAAQRLQLCIDKLMGRA